MNSICFFLFLTERTRYGWCGLFVDRHADQQKQVARRVLCHMFQLQPGCQSRNALRLSCCASIANDNSAEQQHCQGGILFCEFFFPFLFLAQRERVSVGADCWSNDMQISRSRWQDVCFVVWSSCNRDASLATNCACPAARRSQTTIRPRTTFSGNSFCEFFFPFSFSRPERTRFGWCGLLVERHADQQKQMARLVLCCVVQLQPGCQSRNKLRLS